jgi:hypothetical protein
VQQVRKGKKKKFQYKLQRNPEEHENMKNKQRGMKWSHFIPMGMSFSQFILTGMKRPLQLE